MMFSTDLCFLFGVILLDPFEISHFLQTLLQSLKYLTLVYRTFVSFQIPPYR
jgi:hypothetical protein